MVTRALAVSQVINQWYNWGRKRCGLPYWSLSGYLKHKVKHHARFIATFDAALLHEAQARGVDGVVCGHLHAPAIRQIGQITYYNDGDWVDNCSALVEHTDGRMELLRWPEVEPRPAHQSPEPAAVSGSSAVS